MSKYRDLWNGRLAKVAEIIIDLFALFATFIFASQIDNYITYSVFPSPLRLFSGAYYESIIYIIAIYLLVMLLFMIAYRTSVIRKKYLNVFISQILALFFGNIGLLIIVYIGKAVGTDFWFTTAISILILFGIQVVIMTIVKFIESKIFDRANRRSVLIYGPKEQALELVREFLLDNYHYKRLKYIIFHDENDVINDKIKNYINEVQDVYITDGVSSESKNIMVSYILQETYKNLFLVPKTYEIGILKSEFDVIDDTLVFRQRTMHLSLEARFFKRIFDILFSFVLLSIAALPMLVTALVIKLQDKGPVFYKQQRIGRNNKHFKIYKFRSMKINSDEKTPTTSQNDSRITKFGKLIRATRIDELPQFINVLKGNMSIVGPRPLLPNTTVETIKEHPEFAYRANVKPGITGLAQVYGRHDTTDIERLRYDLFYVRKYSFILDITIFLLTIRVVLSKTAGLGKYENKNLEEIMNQAGIATNDIPNGLKVYYTRK